MSAPDEMAAVIEVTPESLGAMEARANAATKGPWKVVERTDDAMVEEGEDCGYCQSAVPLVSQEDYAAEFGHPAYSMHHHEADAHEIVAGEVFVAGNYDYEGGGIIRGEDTAFIAAARTEHPALIAAVRERDESLDEYAQLCDRQAAILTRAANALKGAPGRLSSHSHHDVGELAEIMMAEIRGLREQVRSMQDDAWRRGYDACKVGDQRHSPFTSGAKH